MIGGKQESQLVHFYFSWRPVQQTEASVKALNLTLLAHTLGMAPFDNWRQLVFTWVFFAVVETLVWVLTQKM